jgi:peptidoglycan hydrolase CwlO-like protein
LKDRLWQCKYSDDREVFDLWVKENIRELLVKCIEMRESEIDFESKIETIQRLENDLDDAHGEIEDLENKIDKLENQISSLVDNCNSDGVA